MCSTDPFEHGPVDPSARSIPLPHVHALQHTKHHTPNTENPKIGRSPAPGGYGSSAIAAEGAGGEETATAATDPPAMAEGKPPAAAGGAAAAPASPPRAPSSVRVGVFYC